ncbi:MAG TPA: MFS transporter [Flavobacteriaceae bacterium]|nr:MFS transporter [Flavobacteriaceae bacterium]MCB9213921.1 MFS transporter [Alteromonas sp.]HPF11094.1 MFS transporter [Flavobacteriaceae bacterium]HQU21238.1 MFS transporter [Flavobacteriaceae bacterium]HQU65710.1 MFS transporter [Flavobacteriaceae bacterium]
MKHFGLKLSLFLIYFVFAALLNSVGILVERSQEVYGVLKADAALLEPFKDLSIAFVSFLIGSILPKIGYKRGMLISLGLVFFGCLGMYFGNSFWAVKILFAITGMTFAIVKVSVYALIGYVTDSKEGHSQLMSFIETIFMLGIIFMYLIFPLFYDDENDPNAWLRGYLLMTAIVGLAFFIVLFSKFDIVVERKQTTINKDILDMLRLFANPMVWLFAVFAFFYVMTEQGIMTWLPTFNKETLHIKASLATQVSVILMASFAIGRFFSGLMVKRIKWIYIASFGLLAAGILVLIVMPMASNVPNQQAATMADLPLVSFLFPLIGLFLAPLYPLVSSTVLSNTEKSNHSALAGILVFVSALGGTSGSVIIGNLFDLLGGNNVFYLSLIPLTILLITLFFLNRKTTT